MAATLAMIEKVMNEDDFAKAFHLNELLHKQIEILIDKYSLPAQVYSSPLPFSSLTNYDVIGNNRGIEGMYQLHQKEDNRLSSVSQ